jgi:hypothetical protein
MLQAQVVCADRILCAGRNGPEADPGSYPDAATASLIY